MEEQLCDPAALIAEMRAGDSAALERLTRCYGERLVAVGRRYCRDAEQAQDAVQDAMVSASEHLTDFRGEGSPEAWLSRMVANACHRMNRGRKNDPALHTDADERVIRAPAADPERMATRGELTEALGRALVDLAPMDRTILLLSDAEGWRGPEIAESLGLSPAAVRKRLSRVRARLRPALERFL